MSEIILKVLHVSKEYKLGQIGGTTLKEELQRWIAKRRNQEDPTRKIDATDFGDVESFLALDNISFNVYKGERVGIIGRNGAGKSTILKLISRITAPTEGDIFLNGRVASMLEVGTGFHGDLTGRENIYMNGAILGMKKREIDSKIEDIIDFSECRQFIDTPVKRYSSGMFVKLAFSVAAHLDSEIMIMDEVLAVGDMAFQKKCLGKMNDVSKTEGKTILYVSHNMNTIRQLCNRCIVLDKGQKVFDGDVEEAINIYIGARGDIGGKVDLSEKEHISRADNRIVTMLSICCMDNTSAIYDLGDNILLEIECDCDVDVINAYLRITINSVEGSPVTMLTSNKGFDLRSGRINHIFTTVDISKLVPGRYTVTPTIYDVNRYGQIVDQDVVFEALTFEIRQTPYFNNNIQWQTRYWGYFYNEPMEVVSFIDKTD